MDAASRPSARTRLRATLVEDAAELEPYLAAWDALAVEQERPYCAPAWMVAWWRELAPPGARLRVALALDGDQLVGIAPCWSELARGPEELRFLAAPVSSPTGPLSAPGREPAVVGPVLAEALAGATPAPRLLRFDDLPRGSPWPELLGRAWPGAWGAKLEETGTLAAPLVSLDGVRDLDQWLQGRSANFRSQARQGRRRLSEAGATPRLLDDPAAIAAALPGLARLHHSRRRPRGGSNVLDEAGRRMLAAAAAELAPAGRLWIWEIAAPEGPVASLLFVAAGAGASYWNGGFDDSWARCRPGLQALLAAIEDAAARGLGELDLGPGDQHYKSRLADRDRTLVSLSVRPRDSHYPLTSARLAPADLRRRLVLALSEEQRTRIKRLLRRGPRPPRS
jgi:CelD/BcsL family acetyltransferase involved in cellulose biosynthesis